MKNKKYLVLIVLFFSLVTTIVFTSGVYSKDQDDYYSQVIQNITVFGEIYKQTSERYVEEIDPEAFIKSGIQGMLNELDPYSTYVEQEAQDEVDIMTRGKYYGVGMRITLRNGWPTCAEQPFPNSPSEKAGIREGDQIIEIDGETTKGLSLSKTAAKLRGKEKGSAVKIKIKRYGIKEPLEFTLLRDEIVVSDIQFAGFVEPGIGLVKLNVFNRGAEKQVTEAIQSLLDQGMESLILDLRGNPGGLLDVAVSVANNFLPKNQLVVSTKGRAEHTNKQYRTTEIPAYPDGPLVVLVSGSSASASEIVAGAIQDYDRGIVMGKESFGKGLVQTIMPLKRTPTGQVSLKLTTAKYYLPSGRLIQRSKVFNRGEDSVLLDKKEVDSTDVDLNKFFTHNGRPVQSASGIQPDVEVKNDPTTRYVIELMRKSMFFNFSLEYTSTHDTLTEDFQVTDAMLKEFFTFVNEKEFDYTPDGFEEIEKLKKIAQDEDYYDMIEEPLAELEAKYDDVNKREKEKSRDDLKYLIKRELAAKYFGNDASYQAGFDRDKTLRAAVEILKDKEAYDNILVGSQVTEK